MAGAVPDIVIRAGLCVLKVCQDVLSTDAVLINRCSPKFEMQTTHKSTVIIKYIKISIKDYLLLLEDKRKFFIRQKEKKNITLRQFTFVLFFILMLLQISLFVK